MDVKVNPGLAVGAVALASCGAGASRSRRPDRRALLKQAASRLGVEPVELREALVAALADEVDAAVAAGHMTTAQAHRIRQRVDSETSFSEPRRW